MLGASQLLLPPPSGQLGGRVPSGRTPGTRPPTSRPSLNSAQVGSGHSASAAAASNQKRVTIEIEALIDGTDLLIIKRNTLQWHHLEWAAVGRHDGRDEPTIISTTTDERTVMDRVLWIPNWEEDPPAQIKTEAFSSTFTGLEPSLPGAPMSVHLTPIRSRNTTSIHQQPSAENDYTLIVQFNDPSGGDDWYIARITIGLSDEAVTRPAGTTRSADEPMSAEARVLLEKLRAADARYKKGFSAVGTIVDGPWPDHPDAARTKREWQLTMDRRHLVLTQRVTGILHPGKKPDRKRPEDRDTGLIRNFPPRQVSYESALIVHPDFNARYDWTKFVPIQAGGKDGVRHVEFGAPGSQYKYLVGDVLWALGRGVSQHIAKITQVSRQQDGTLAVTATGSGTLVRRRWELVIDPNADYMIRCAKLGHVHVVNSGTQWFGKCCVPAKGRRLHSAGSSLTFKSARPEFDKDLLRTAEGMIHPPYPVATRLLDSRVCPELSVGYEAESVVGSIGAIHYASDNPTERPKWKVAQQVAEQFLEATHTGKIEVAGTLANPTASRQLEDLRKLVRQDRLTVRSVHLNDDRTVAVAITSDVSPQDGAAGPLLMRLVEQEDTWVVDRIDMRLAEPITRRLIHVLKKPVAFPGLI